MIRLAQFDQPIVIHLQEVTGDRYGLDVTCACLLLMKEIYHVPAKGPCQLSYGNRPVSKRVAVEIQKRLFWSHRRSPQLRPEATGRTTRHPKSQIIVGV